jgi:adenylate cyclase
LALFTKGYDPVAPEREERRLAAILAADMVGYSRLMEADERGTIARQKAHREELIDPTIAEHDGRIVKTTGDGLLVEFGSVVDAVACAVAIQRAMAAREGEVAEKRRIRYRVGINLGDIVIDGDDIHGDGVNVAARLESLAEPGGICIPRKVLDEVRTKLDVGYKYIGLKKVKNIQAPLPVYRVLLEPATAGKVIGETLAFRARGRWAAVAATVVLAIAVGGLWWWPKAPFLALTESGRTELARPDKASLALLPLENISGDPDQDVFVKGLTEDLNAALSRVPSLLVISQNSMARYRGKTVDARQVAGELGVDQVLVGSVQRSADQLRVSVQLIDGETGVGIWSRRYDRQFEDLFALQDEIVRDVLIELQVTLTVGDAARVLARGTDNLEAWLLNIQAIDLAFKFEPESNRTARELFSSRHGS